jgi:hypothetical protein
LDLDPVDIDGLFGPRRSCRVLADLLRRHAFGTASAFVSIKLGTVIVILPLCSTSHFALTIVMPMMLPSSSSLTA